jgi:hypothetical protein
MAPDCFILSNLRPSDTGVEGAVLWISAGEFDPREAQHGPRIMVTLGERLTADRLTGTAVPRMETDGANIYAGVEYGVDMEPSALARVPTRQRASR